MLRSGDAFNVVPGAGELVCDLRADASTPSERVVDALPAEVGGVAPHAELMRLWPGMDSEAATAPLLERASAALGRRSSACRARRRQRRQPLRRPIPLTVDGLGPRGGNAHNPEEFVLAASLAAAREVALAVVERGAAASSRDRDRLELARAQQHEQLAAAAVEADRGDAALLEVDARRR